MDLRKLKTLIDLVAESGIAELEITEGEDKVKIVKSNAGPQTSHISHVYTGPSGSAAPASAPAVVAPATPAESAAAAAALSAAEGKIIKSPMVGTFYRAASPGSDPFVSVGTEVKEGQALCVIEAMKLMNEIPADTAGVIKEILVENGQPVEFGQPLFVLA
jgi:acetyl-CoA carboxylase biotin carboxyl carrier protein